MKLLGEVGGFLGGRGLLGVADLMEGGALLALS